MIIISEFYLYLYTDSFKENMLRIEVLVMVNSVKIQASDPVIDLSNSNIDYKSEVDIISSQTIQIDTTNPNLGLEQEKLHKFYNLAEYYDLAFLRDADRDIEFFINCFKRYCDHEVKNILEPACGPGLFLASVPKFGFFILGYDLNPAMIMFAKERLKDQKITTNSADAVIANMINAKFDQKFDAAFICINSLGYLKYDIDILLHFQNMNDSLNDGGIYIVEISFKCDDIKNEKRIDDTWHVKNVDIELEVTWAINWYQFEKRIRHVDFKMRALDKGEIFDIEESHDLRLWIFDEFKEFTKLSGFEIAGIFNQNYEEISLQNTITGELGALFIILKKT
jgi:SAM-dependent methyltransferase